MTKLLSVKDLAVSYGASQVVNGIDLEVNRGEVVALMGRNGVGKSTTVGALAGIVPTAGGTVEFDGDDITEWTATKRSRAGMALVAQGRRLFGELTVEENLIVGKSLAKHRRLGPYGWTFDDTYERFPVLHDRRKGHAGLLSGGEQQMVAIARAMVTYPELVLLDEPSEGLAPLIVEQVGEIVREIRANGGTVLIVEQNLGLGMGVADRVYLMSKGEIVASGPTEDVQDNTELMHEYLGVG